MVHERYLDEDVQPSWQGGRSAFARPQRHCPRRPARLVEDDQVAYGMVRVKCEVATHCLLYLECDDQDGHVLLRAGRDPVPGRSTRVLTAEDLSSELGLMDGDWESGRMSCSIYSTRTIFIQQLTRSSTGVLVKNNTYVDD